MHIWRLTPVAKHLNSPQWNKSTCKDPVLVRARTADQARELAREMLQDKRAGEPWRNNPWMDPPLVQCEQATNTGSPDEGEPGILEPTRYRHTPLWHQVS